MVRAPGAVAVRSQGCKQRLQTTPLRRGQTVWLRRVLYRDAEPVEVNVVLTWRHRTKEAWILVTDLAAPPHTIIACYGRRMQIEESFRDTKSVRWGLRLRHVRLSTWARYERLVQQ